MIVDSQTDFRSLLVSALAPTCDVTQLSTGQSAEEALEHGVFHAVIINMEIASSDPLLLARRAAELGCGTILIPDQPSEYNAAVRAGHLILSKPFRYVRLMELVDEACIQARPRFGTRCESSAMRALN